MDHSLSIHLLKHISVASKFWQLWIKLLLTSMCWFFCGHKFSVHLGKYQETRIAGSYGKSMFSFIRNHQTVIKWLFHFAFSPAMNGSSSCSTALLTFGVDSVLDFGPSNRIVVLSHCFNFHFPNDIWCGTSFHVLICHLYIFFGEVSLKVFGLPFFFFFFNTSVLEYNCFTALC